MSIDAIVACRDLAVWKPLPMWVVCAGFESLVCFIEGSAGFLVPVEVGCLFFPETLGVGEGMVLDFVLWVRIWRGHCEGGRGWDEN